jgi:multicomponent Na+:H+ antiporter subunit D
MPFTATGFLICGLSLIGLPLTAGFISKLYLITAVIEAGYWQIVAIVLFSSALSVIYLWRLIEVMWFTPSNSGDGRLPEQVMIYAPLWILALANIWFGISASTITEMSYGAAQVLMGGMT